MNILLLSAYDAASHRSWHRALQQNMVQHQWRVLTLPPRNFSWRIRGNSLTWACDQTLGHVLDYDLLIATSMTDLSSLRGMRPDLCRLPTLLYFHENQFVYPSSKNQFNSIEPQMVQLYSAICADKIVFNSHYNKNSFLQGVDDLLKKLPDCVPKGIRQKLEAKSQCLVVPISEAFFTPMERGCTDSEHKMQIVWNHRWEYDKGPELLAECIDLLPPSLSLQFHIVGQQFRSSPNVFEKIYSLLKSRDWLGEWGFIESREEYYGLLVKADVVLSTAEHDFQGLSVLEAVASGCIPLVPDKLVYPEWFDESYRYSMQGGGLANLCESLVVLAGQFDEGCLPKVPSMEPFRWLQVQEGYQNIFLELSALRTKTDLLHC